jgi:hypothetical protein
MVKTENCPACGSVVEIVSSGEGTNYYVATDVFCFATAFRNFLETEDTEAIADMYGPEFAERYEKPWFDLIEAFGKAIKEHDEWRDRHGKART